jgi:hypothetical protein
MRVAGGWMRVAGCALLEVGCELQEAGCALQDSAIIEPHYISDGTVTPLVMVETTPM